MQLQVAHYFVSPHGTLEGPPRVVDRLEVDQTTTTTGPADPLARVGVALTAIGGDCAITWPSGAQETFPAGVPHERILPVGIVITCSAPA
jgi:hypothetical protein